MTALSQNESTVQGQRRKAQVLGALSGGQCHLIVCVDMLGEAFDMPNLKIAVFHDNRGSLGPVIQLVGLLARTQSSTPIGPASVFVSRDPTTQFSPLRKLLRDHRLRRSHRPNRAPRYSAGATTVRGRRRPCRAG
jgi:superfamily II DNA or RNA helicase